MGKALLDAARLRAGDPLEGSDLDAAVRVLVHARIPLLLTTDGHVAQVTRADVEKAVSQVPDAAWMTAYAEHCRRPSTSISAPSSSGSPSRRSAGSRATRPSCSRRCARCRPRAHPALASGDESLRARVADRIAKAPSAVQAIAGAAAP